MHKSSTLYILFKNQEHIQFTFLKNQNISIIVFQKTKYITNTLYINIFRKNKQHNFKIRDKLLIVIA